VLTVAHKRDYAPYEFVDADGKSAGMAIDMITEAARRLDMEVRFHPLSWPEVLENLSAGKADITPCMLYSPARAKEWALSVGWGKATSVVYVRRTSKFETVADVVPKVVVAPRGDIEYEALKMKGVRQLIGTETTEQALMKTLVGEAAGAGCNREVARAVFSRFAGLKTAMLEVEPPLAVTPLMVGSRKGNEPLLYRISRVLLEMKRDGTLDRLTSTSEGQPSG
jgi:polar amino acid transport system substrate-binding protein